MAETDNWVEMGRPDVEPTFTCHPDAVEFWEGLGWSQVAADQPPADQPARPVGPPSGRPDVTPKTDLKTGGNS